MLAGSGTAAGSCTSPSVVVQPRSQFPEKASMNPVEPLTYVSQSPKRVESGPPVESNDT